MIVILNTHMTTPFDACLFRLIRHPLKTGRRNCLAHHVLVNICLQIRDHIVHVVYLKYLFNGEGILFEL